MLLIAVPCIIQQPNLVTPSGIVNVFNELQSLNA